MKRYIKASITPSAPDWLKRVLQSRWGGSIKNGLLKRGIALDKVEFTKEKPVGGNSLPIYLIATDYGTEAYAPGVNDDTTAIINGRTRKLGSIAKSKIPEMAVDAVYIDLADPASKAPRKERYRDPRYEYRSSSQGRYAGQYKRQNYNYDTHEYDEGYEWSKMGKTPTNESRARDKSGYKIPSPESMIARYYEKYPDKVTQKIDSVYARILEVKDKLMAKDFNTPYEYGDTNIRNAYSLFGDAASEYRRLLNMIDENGRLKQSRSGTFYTYDPQTFSNQISTINSRLDDVEEYLNAKDR